MKRRMFEVPDHALWDDLKKSVAPLKARHGPRPGKLVSNARPIPADISLRPHHTFRDTHNPPPLMAFDRRLSQRLMRGQIEPDARIDLHGEIVETARVKLLHFLQSQYHHGNRLVLVITGKGSTSLARHTLHGREHYHAPEREGRLRREIPLALQETAFRSLVIGYQPAHPRHGGGGAIYVRLRRISGVHP